jgi:hypothetical protein
MRADLAAGVDLDIVVKRALSAGIKRSAVAEFLGLSRPQVYRSLSPAREVAQIGAVIGRDFSYSLLRAVGWPVPAACTALVERPGEVVGNDDSNYYSRPMAFGAVRLVRRRRYQARR